MKKHLGSILYGLSLFSFTVFVLLDTFVITRVYSTVPLEQNSEGTTETHINIENTTKISEEIISSDKNTEVFTETTIEETAGVSDVTPIITENSYIDENISIILTEYREYNTNIYVADVQISSAEYLKTALAQNSYGKNVTQKTSEMAQNNNAILAINGDYYGAQEKGYVLRNGILYRNTSSKNKEDLVIYKDGSPGIITESEISADELLSNGAEQILSFGPALVIDSLISVTEDEEVGKAAASNPRTAIGVIDSLHYVFVVSDGRTKESAGLSLYELAEFMERLGAVTAYNLDGGGSSTMYFNGEIINTPTTDGKKIKERKVSDIVYIGY